MLKIGIKSDAYFGFEDYEAGMALMKEHGYDGFDYQGLGSLQHSPLYKMGDGEFVRYLTDIKDCAKANGLEIYQLHGTWPHVDDTTAEGREKTIECFKKNIYAAKILGCPRVIVHPCMPRLYSGGPICEEEDFEVNLHLLESLVPTAKENGVTVCFENMPFPKVTSFSFVKNIKKLLTQINDNHIKACLDVGHFNVEKGDIYEAIRLLGDDLAALHIHDDRFGQDRHLFPFLGETDWGGFIRGLKEIAFKGVISLETQVPTSMPEPMLGQMRIALSGLAKWFAGQIDD